MDKDKREGWLRELKVGDKVAIEVHWYTKVNYKIATITRTTYFKISLLFIFLEGICII